MLESAGRQIQAPLQVQPSYSYLGNERKCLPPLLQVAGTTPNGRLFVLVLASSGYPCWAQFCGKRESGSEWGHSKCETLRGYCLERDEVPSLLLQAGPASSSIGDSFDLSP